MKTIKYERPENQTYEKFVVGDTIIPIANRIEKTSIDKNTVYAIVSVMDRWSRKKLTIGKTEIESIVSIKRPPGEGWVEDKLLALIPVFNKASKRAFIPVNTLTAGAYYFKKYKDGTIIKSLERRVEDIKYLILAGDQRGFESEVEILKITERQY